LFPLLYIPSLHLPPSSFYSFFQTLNFYQHKCLSKSLILLSHQMVFCFLLLGSLTAMQSVDKLQEKNKDVDKKWRIKRYSVEIKDKFKSTSQAALGNEMFFGSDRIELITYILFIGIFKGPQGHLTLVQQNKNIR
uniref:Uncharacterized protein n=1 Tax=Oreochromis niloticus TaxID=8128 RepID=A0A669CQC6_ORENI